MARERGKTLEKVKMGRPTDNPKPYKITVRVDEKGKDILQRYCEQKKVNQMEAVRNAIYKLEYDIQDGTNTND